MPDPTVTPTRRRQVPPIKTAAPSETLSARDAAVLLAPISAPAQTHILRRRQRLPDPEPIVTALRTTSVRKETKKQRFRRIAIPRTENALHAIDLLKFCASPIRYDFTPDQARRIVDTLLDKVGELEVSFVSRTVVKPSTFSIDDED